MDFIYTLQNLQTRSKIAFKNCKNCYIIYEKICAFEKYDKISYSTFRRRVLEKKFRFLNYEVVMCNIVRTNEMKDLNITFLIYEDLP